MLGAARAGWCDAPTGDHDRRSRLRGRASEPVVHQGTNLPGWLAAIAGGAVKAARATHGSPGPRPGGHHRSLRRDPAQMAGIVRRTRGRTRGPRLRPRLPEALGAVPRLLRGRVRGAQDLRHPAAPRQASAPLRHPREHRLCATATAARPRAGRGARVTAIVWFRRDLRLHDNPALSGGCARTGSVVPVFCLDPRLLHGRNRSLPRTRFMLGCVAELARDLAARGSDLLVLRGTPAEVLPELAAACDAEAVLAADDVSPFARTRDRAVAAALAAAGCRLELLPGTFTVDDLTALRTGTGDPYSVFTPFYRRWLEAPRREPLPAPASIPPLPDGLERSAV